MQYNSIRLLLHDLSIHIESNEPPDLRDDTKRRLFWQCAAYTQDEMCRRFKLGPPVNNIVHLRDL